MKRAQVWYTDFIIGVLIFTIAVTTFFFYSSGATEEEGNLNDLIVDSKVIAESLVSGGYPTDWTPSTVERVGLTDGSHRIEQSKLSMFSSMSYAERKSALGTTKSYYFYLQYQNGTRFNLLGQEGNSSKKLVQITRLVVYDSQPIKMVLHLWE